MSVYLFAASFSPNFIYTLLTCLLLLNMRKDHMDMPVCVQACTVNLCSDVTLHMQCAGCQVYHKFVDNLGLVVEYDLREENGMNTDTET